MENHYNDVYGLALTVHRLPLDVIREYKDKIDFAVRSNGFSFYDILRYNKNIDFNFIREFINEFKDQINLREVLGIIDYRFGGKQYLELLRIWVDWNVENKTEGLY